MLIILSTGTMCIDSQAQDKSTLSCIVEKTEKKEILQVQIVLDGENKIASGQTILSYDTKKVRLVNVQKGKALTSEQIAMANVNSENEGNIQVTFLCDVEQWITDGELVIAEFELLEQNAEGIEFLLTENELNNTTFEMVDVDVNYGEVPKQSEEYADEQKNETKKSSQEKDVQSVDSIQSESKATLKEDADTLSRNDSVKKEQTTDAKEGDWNILYMILGGVCVIVLAGIIYVRKKNKEQ